MLTTTRSVIAALGGSVDVQEILKCTRENVNSWNRQRKFPAHHYVEMTEALADIAHKTAHAGLWKQKHYRAGKRRRVAGKAVRDGRNNVAGLSR